MKPDAFIPYLAVIVIISPSLFLYHLSYFDLGDPLKTKVYFSLFGPFL